ncbi:MAG: TrkH family potassium uptake protein [Planctomycetota bacterium]|jgi:trk system potassium uptake protein TrkH
MRVRQVFGLLGLLLRPYSFLMLFPAAVDFYYGNLYPAVTFILCGIMALLVSRLLVKLRDKEEEIGRVEAMAVVANAWLMAAAIGCLPYIQQGLSPIDAYFESMSGFTTTGSTIFVAHHWDTLSEGLMFWRCMTQWIGGMGIIVLFVAILPALAVAGRQMFFAEAPGPEEEALTPRIRHTALALWKLYIGLTALEAVLLATLTEMTVYESICHALTTLAAGGFSPNPGSIMAYSATAQWIITGFMFLAGTSFALQYRAIVKRPTVLARDSEFRLYALITVMAALFMAVILAGWEDHGFESSLRAGFFQAASILTTTGYASEDFILWPQAAMMVLLMLMFIGGCAGSAAGGPKVVRVLVLAKFLAREVLRTLHPRAVKKIRVGGRALPEDTMGQIVGFFVAYGTIFLVVALAAGVIENDLWVGITGSIVTLGNIGPGFGALGPMATFGELSVLTKILFIFNMWVGRLEVLAVFVLFHPDLLRTLFQSRDR